MAFNDEEDYAAAAARRLAERSPPVKQSGFLGDAGGDDAPPLPPDDEALRSIGAGVPLPPVTFPVPKEAPSRPVDTSGAGDFPLPPDEPPAPMKAPPPRAAAPAVAGDGGDEPPAKSDEYSQYGDLRKALGDQAEVPADNFSWLARTGEGINAAFMRRKPDNAVADEIDAASAARRRAPMQRYEQGVALEGARQADKDRATLPDSELDTLGAPHGNDKAGLKEWMDRRLQAANIKKAADEPGEKEKDRANTRATAADTQRAQGERDVVNRGSAQQIEKMRESEKAREFDNPHAPLPKVTVAKSADVLRREKWVADKAETDAKLSAWKAAHPNATLAESRRYHDALLAMKPPPPERLNPNALAALATDLKTSGSLTPGFTRAGIAPQVANAAFPADRPQPADLTTNRADTKAKASALAGLTKRGAGLSAFEGEAGVSGNIVREASARATRTGIPIIDQYVLPFESALGNSDSKLLVNAIHSYTPIFAKIMTGSLGAQAATDSANKYTQEMLAAKDNPAVVIKILDQMQREMAGALGSNEAAKGNVRASIGSTAPAATADRPPPGQPAGAHWTDSLGADWVRDAAGHWGEVKNGP